MAILTAALAILAVHQAHALRTACARTYPIRRARHALAQATVNIVLARCRRFGLCIMAPGTLVVGGAPARSG